MDFGLGDERNRNEEIWHPADSSLVTGHSSLFFAYGTLRRGFCRHKFLKALGAQFLTCGTVRGELYDLGEFPGATPSLNPAFLIHGEVFRLPHATRALRVLDWVEGMAAGGSQSSRYRRETAEAKLRNGLTVKNWIYWLNRTHEPKRRIRSGDYILNP